MRRLALQGWMARHQINPGVINRLLRENLIEEDGHWRYRITSTGRLALLAVQKET